MDKIINKTDRITLIESIKKRVINASGFISTDVFNRDRNLLVSLHDVLDILEDIGSAK